MMSLTPDLVAFCHRDVPEPPRNPDMIRFTDADYDRAAAEVLARLGDDPIWVFAYGSLVWKPAGDIAEQRLGTAFGWHPPRQAPPLRLVGYVRVSTAQQGASGLGFAAPTAAIARFVADRGAQLVASLTEIESDRMNDRPELARALHLARVTAATPVIARIDRLSRNAAFLFALRDSGVRFLACDMPGAHDLTVGIMALVAEAEREAISRRTTEALAAARARGVRLCNPNGATALRLAGKGGTALQAHVAANADGFAADLAPVLAEIRATGQTPLRAIAASLAARAIRTRRGGQWQVSNVDLIGRIDRSCGQGGRV